MNFEMSSGVYEGDVAHARITLWISTPELLQE